MTDEPESIKEPLEDDEDDEEWDDEDEWDEVIRAKWIMDGAETLGEAARRVRAFADHLDSLAAEGWSLRQPVESDYGFLKKPQ